MYAVKAMYDGVDFIPIQPIPINESYEVIITFINPIEKKQTDILGFFNSWQGKELIDIDEIMAERENFFSGRTAL